MIAAVLQIFIFFKLIILISLFNSAIASHHNEDKRLFKAAFVYNFAKFTTWPDNTAHKPNIKLCTQGNDQLVTDLTRLKGKIIKGKELSVIPLNNIGECNMLYIGASSEQNFTEILKMVRNKPILTISEIDNFARSGGIIELNHQKGQTSIIINLETARTSNLELSSRLLMLADIIPEKIAK